MIPGKLVPFKTDLEDTRLVQYRLRARAADVAGATTEVRCGSCLCENAGTLDGDRTSYSFKTVLAVNLASGFNLEKELEECNSSGVSIFRVFTRLGSRANLGQ